ncbi:MAG: Mpo1-like protein [Phycisphaerae bacterium]|nr:Mpo1-like protein [Phycisphaerae bacterium]
MRDQPAWLANWLERHQTPLSFWLHVVGIPLTILAVVLAGYQLWLWRWDLWWRPTLLLFVGYLLQWLGHWHEGNDMGEVILVKKLLGQPYVAVAPQFQTPPEAQNLRGSGG